MAGDPTASRPVGGPDRVSIRARHRWRAIRIFRLAVALPRIVSIRARHRWRAILYLGSPAVLVLAFQSAPAIDGGRSRFLVILREHHAKFQSAPAIDGGRSGRPARRPGTRPRVSIRARHRWRAILHIGQCSSQAALFQSAPAIDGGRSVDALFAFSASAPFQSAPAIDGGRSCRRAASRGSAWRCFNPRPPSMAGDPCATAPLPSFMCAFQSAPAIDGGRSEGLRDLGLYRKVSIRARHRWRAIRSCRWSSSS